MDYVIDRFDVEGGKTHDWFLHGMCEEEGKLETSISMDRLVKTLVPEWGGTAVPMNQYDSDIIGKKIHAYSYMKDIKAGMASKTWTVTWTYQNSGLRTHNIPQKDTEIFSFRAPSVRLAAEDDNKLDNFMRLGIMQRHNGNQSSFVAIHEPFKSKPWIKLVRADGDTYLIDYELNGKNIQDRISLKGDEISLISGAGWNYAKGRASSGTVRGIENSGGKHNLELDSSQADVSYVRLDFPDNSSLYFPAKNISGNIIQLDNDPGFSMEKGGKTRFYTFPHNEYSEPVCYTVFSKSIQ
jgi:hypothetical protein